jgi:DNA polymerase-3 subunit epsilon
MPRLHQFVRGLPIVAHNAAFDRGFLRAELARAGLKLESEFLCTMRLARRLVPGLPSYRLDALVDSLEVRKPDARHGKVFASATTWTRLVRARGWLRPRKRSASQLSRIAIPTRFQR